MTFYVHAFGGGGCDYTLACNEHLQELEATTWEEAEAEVAEIVAGNIEKDESGWNEIYGIDEVKILLVAEEREFDVEACLKRAAKVKEAKGKQQEEEIARQQYEKLQKRFGKK